MHPKLLHLRNTCLAFALLVPSTTTWGGGDFDEPLPHLRNTAFRDERVKQSNIRADGRQGSFTMPCSDLNTLDDLRERVTVGGLVGYRMPVKEKGIFFGAGYSLRENEIIPFLGHLYRVGQCKHLYAPITWILPKDLPPGSAPLKTDSFCVPLKRFGIGGAHLDGQGIVVTEIPTGKAVAQAKLILGEQQLPVEIRLGDLVLLTKKHTFEVRNIVPADAKLKTAGWVEFAPSFIPEAELIRDKKTYVKPMPAKDGQK